MASRKWRLVTAQRMERGLWASATCCQRVLMIVGGLVLAFGCHVICQNEDIWLLCQQGLGQVLAAAPVELPCSPDSALRAPLVHLEGCSVSGSTYSASTPGLEELRFFEGCLPSGGVRGAWFKANLEMFDGSSVEWVPLQEAGNLHTIEKVSHEVHIGGFSASGGIAHLIPGSGVPLEACNSSVPSSATGVLSGKTMQMHNNALFSGDPLLHSDGDVKVTFLVGDSSKVSVLCAASGGHLHQWEIPLGGLRPLIGLPKLGVVEAGAVTAEAMRSRLQRRAQVSFLDLWPLRAIGLALIWMGMSLILFPNHVVPDFCGKSCCCRSLPGALATTATTAGASWCYFRARVASSVAALVLVPLLLAMAAGMDLRKCLRQARLCFTGPPAGDDEIPYHVLEATGAVGSSLSRGIRMGALGIGVGLVIAGPAVQSVALISFLGDWWDAFQQ